MMNSKHSILVATTVLLLTSGVGVTQAPASQCYSTDMSLALLPGSEGTYEITAVVKDLGIDAVISTPRILIRGDQQLGTISVNEESGFTTQLLVSIDDATPIAEYTVACMNGDITIFSHRVLFDLGT